LWMGFVRNFTDIDTNVTLHLRYKRFLRIITDYTGRERSLIGQLIAGSMYPTPETVADLQRGQGIVALSWQISRELADQGRLYPIVGPYYDDAFSHYSTMSGIVQGILDVPQARTGVATYPVSLDLWFELSTQAADSFAALRDVSIRATREHIDRLIAGTQRSIAAAALVFILALLLCGYSFWTISRRVIRPINQVIDALLRVMRGEEVSFVTSARAQDEIGKLAVVLNAFQQNMEEVKRTSAELNRSQGHLRAVVDHAVDGLITVDVKGVVTSFNPACERIFGYSVNEVVGQSVKMLVPEAYREDYHSDVTNYLATGETAVIDGTSRELTARRNDGTIFPIDLSISTFTFYDGRYFSGIVRDITARKDAYKKLSLYTRALERSNKELDEFAYIASHDLKEPLRGIHNHSRFLLEDNEGKLDEDSVGRIKRLTYLSQRMERLVNDLLYFSRIGRQELSVGAADLNLVIEDIESTLETFLAERNARVLVPQRLPIVTCDKIRIAEVFRNLITNAVKYSDSKDKTVEIGCQDAPQTTRIATAARVFYVKDNGKGIDPEFHEDIFRMFKRLQKSSDTEEGTGVGLTFVKKIVERHGGRVWLESELGKGTTFFFTLEASRDEKRSDARAA
ncbi:MAG TPA: ATP-binding protein, partial [Steroidobacteraceae bacterium]|nr:ATP-binding protein [Steroidobacteraceae bacterium]